MLGSGACLLAGSGSGRVDMARDLEILRAGGPIALDDNALRGIENFHQK